jgi:hypothetical protein
MSEALLPLLFPSDLLSTAFRLKNASAVDLPADPKRNSNMLDVRNPLYLNQVTSRSDPTLLQRTFRHENPIPFCLRRAPSVRERRFRRRLLSAHERRANDRLE